MYHLVANSDLNPFTCTCFAPQAMLSDVKLRLSRVLFVPLWDSLKLGLGSEFYVPPWMYSDFRHCGKSLKMFSVILMWKKFDRRIKKHSV